MEKSTPIGIGAGLVLIYGSIFMGQGWQTFFDPASIVMVIGGTIAALLVTHSFSELKLVPGGTKACFSFQEPDLRGYLDLFVEFSRVARREGLLALDRRLGDTDDEFVRFGLEMAVDGIEEVEIDELMRMRINEDARNQAFYSKFYMNAGTYAPAFGMIGTLVGLIQMMQSLDDPAQIGAGMAVALITTFYGALFANLICLPLGTKLKNQAAMTSKARQMVRMGVLAIVRGESPSMIEKRLSSFVEDGQAAADAAAETPLKKAA